MDMPRTTPATRQASRVRFARHFDLQIAPRAPPQRLELGRGLAPGYELVGNSFDVAACDLLAIALFPLRIVERFRIRDPDLGVRAAADRQLRICRLQSAMVEEKSDVRVRGHLQRRGGKRGKRAYPI